MSTSTRVTVAQYDEMVRRGVFEPREEHHVELLYGEILPMGPIGPPHTFMLAKLNGWSFDALPRNAVWVSVQGPIGVPELDSEPQPDLVWLRRGDFQTEHARPSDVLLLIEVSDSSLDKDRGVKARLYAEAGVEDYWVVNLRDRCVEVRRGPRGGAYASVETFGAGREVRSLAFPEAVLPVDRLFPA